MESTIGGRRLAGSMVIGAALVAASLLPAPAASAAPGSAGPAGSAGSAQATSRIEFAYAAPEIAEAGDHITWTWTLQNTGDLQADRVVVIHTLNANMPVREVSQECVTKGTVVRCVYGTIAPGQKRTGFIDSGLPEDTDATVQVSGRVIWQQGAQRGGARSVRFQG